MNISTHLDHISHFKAGSGKNWSNIWTYQVFITKLCHAPGLPGNLDVRHNLGGAVRRLGLSLRVRGLEFRGMHPLNLYRSH